MAMMENKDNKEKFSTCLEGMPFAGLMQKMIGQQGVGSLCSEMMKKVMAGHGDGTGFHCLEMMRLMKGKTEENTENPKDGREEGNHVTGK
jgi:hypothetical protein